MRDISAVICWIIAQVDNVRGIWLFGSQVTGRARNGSDWDMIVETDAPKPTLERRIEMRRESSGLFGVEVDVVVVRDCAEFVRVMRIPRIEAVYISPNE